MALCFVHLLKDFQILATFNHLLLSLWKLFKYSSVKFAVFANAQIQHGCTPVKILKASATRWLTHGLSSCRIILRFEPLINCLDVLYNENGDNDAKALREMLLDPMNVCMLLLMAELLKHVNSFSMFLQTRNLNFTEVSSRF